MEVSKREVEETRRSPRHLLFVSVLIGTRDRPKALFRCLKSILIQNYQKLEILVLDDCSERYDICDLLNKYHNDHRLRCFRSGRQLGIAGGRNFLMQQARGEIFVFIDDDAISADPQCLSRITGYFENHATVGIIATKVIDQSSSTANLLVPLSKRLRRKQTDVTEKMQLVSWYMGTCHAIHREVIAQCGFYMQNLVYGCEEFDLSFRAIQNNFAIIYAPDVIVYHRPEPSALGNGARGVGSEFYFYIRNRIWLGYQCLPLTCLLVYFIIWFAYYLLVSIKHLQLGVFMRGILVGVLDMKQVPRTPLSKQTIAYLKKNFGRLWY